ncbi:MAG TPA: AraC family transcriptional regulator [Puia sp.]|uniref:helix-turn-helix transcriptional regulator n=1 Tax=Puia sp. TaxID=2045100 RepID=UPI002B70C657|nr:AraC family transcriptional regulator [Puia sp.]HVU95354.1 AraC family transcriptional regulator [Puia sp.]
MMNVHDFLQSQGDDFKKLSFKDLLFVHYRCPQEERYSALYTHLNYILYVIDGKKIFHHGDYFYPLNTGACAFIRKGGFHQERFFDKGWQVMAFFIPDHYLRSVVAEYQHSVGVRPLPRMTDEPVITLHVTELSHDFFHSMISYFLEPAGVPEPLVEMKVKEMMFLLLSDPENQALLAYLSRIDDKETSLREVMEANFLYNLSLDEFARITNRSLSAFKRDFLALYGMPPGKWLLQRRLDHAERLLLHSDKLVADVADECGFESQTHFNRVFKDRFGMAPLQYRGGKIEPER